MCCHIYLISILSSELTFQVNNVSLPFTSFSQFWSCRRHRRGPDSLSAPWSAAVDISPIDRTVVSNPDPQGGQDAGGKVRPNVLRSRFPSPISITPVVSFHLLYNLNAREISSEWRIHCFKMLEKSLKDLYKYIPATFEIIQYFELKVSLFSVV